METTNRRLIRPLLNEAKDKMATRKAPASAQNKKAVPPDQTNAENYYYVKQMQSKTPMTIVLMDGETLTGVIEWYDKRCLKVNREGAPNLLIFKPNAKPLSAEGVGKYAIKFSWNDNHDLGIYSWKFLREVCPCEDCKKARAAV